MRYLRTLHFLGGRIIKTGIAVFFTALICHLLGWPSMFAVITAIVTVEPTADGLIRKAIVRFTASGIGAGFSVLFTFMFGDKPITYMMVAMATIIVCHRAKLEAGLLVAVLTGVAMIPTVHNGYMEAFFIRLGTTVTGLLVANVVNLFMIRPNYTPVIQMKVNQLIRKSRELLEIRCKELAQLQPLQKKTKKDFKELLKEVEEVESLCQFQKGWKLKRLNHDQKKAFYYQRKRLNLLRQIHSHLGTLIELPATELLKEKGMVAFLNRTLKNPEHWEVRTWDFLREAMASHTDTSENFTNSIVVSYELLSIRHLFAEVNKIKDREKKSLGEV